MEKRKLESLVREGGISALRDIDPSKIEDTDLKILVATLQHTEDQILNKLFLTKTPALSKQSHQQ